MLSGKIELNPGPKKSSINTLSICHWSLSNLSTRDYARDYAKVFLLKACIQFHISILSLHLKHLDSNTNPIKKCGNNLIQYEHSSNN